MITTQDQVIQQGVYSAFNTYSVPNNPYYQPMNHICYTSDKHKVNATLSNTGLICGVAAAIAGAGLTYHIYKKYIKK